LKSLKEKLNGNTGFVITSGMILILISIITFGVMLTSRLEARTKDIAERCVETKTEQMRTDIATIKSDNQWMKEALSEIKLDLKDLKRQ
jgi:hypothetical protein